MDKDELNEKVRLLVTKLLGNYCMAISAEEAQEIISTVLDAVEEAFKTSAGRMPDWSDKEDYLEILSEAINKLR